MELAINNALIADFENLTFKKLNVAIKDGITVELSKTPIKAENTIDASNCFLSPGLIDCHCHIESSYLTPKGFGFMVRKFGTLFVVADCHEIANVKGLRGLEFFIEDSKDAAINIKFTAPSCVPATEFATSGGRLELKDIEHLLKMDSVVALGELMNVPAVVNGDMKFMKMIELAKNLNKRINGHAPELDYETLKTYKSRGIEDDHESYSYDEIKQKLDLGFFVFLREGSTEKTQDEAYKLINKYPNQLAFCSDDKTIGDILKLGHIDFNLKKAIRLGIDPILALKVASYNGLNYYHLNEYSQIKEGNKAELVIFDRNFNAIKTISQKRDNFSPTKANNEFTNTINVSKPITIPNIKVKNYAIGVKDGSLITQKLEINQPKDEYDLKNNILKLVNIERYGHNNSAACFIKGFNIKNGAMATSLSHDCHNILAVGSSDEFIKKAIEIVISNQGGQVVVGNGFFEFLPLKIGGIVSCRHPKEVAESVEKLREAAKKIGCRLSSPLGSLSFMALEVIPHLKLTDKGLFDVDTFNYLESK